MAGGANSAANAIMPARSAGGCRPVRPAKVIILDEPFTAIDAKTTHDLLDLVQRWHGERRTIVAVLHDTLAHSVATMVDIRALLPNRLLMAVSALGPVFDESEGIAAQVILADPIALSVKLACIADLADPLRLARLEPFTRRRRESSSSTLWCRWK